MESLTKICKQCKEEIKASAKKCRYCHLLPNTEHAFRIRESADKSEAEYTSHKIFIRDARDADSWR